MTAVSVLLAEVRAAGVRLGLDGGKLRIKVPGDVLTTAQRERLVEHRTEIAALLAEPENAVSPVIYLQPPLEDAVPHPPPAEPMLEDVDRLQRIVGSAGRLGGLSTRLDYARPPHRWGDFTDALREWDWRARMDAVDERAAIAEVDGGLNRDAAERLAQQEVTSAPAGDDVTSWRAWMRSRLPVWRERGLSAREAALLVWAEAESAWHLRHLPPPDPDRCAGCGEWMLDGPGMRLLDGAVIHFGNPDRLDCLLIYGETWRAAASAGLVALGLRKPA
jgi:hypothetical protein